MDKKKMWILGGILIIVIIITATLLFLNSIPEKNQSLTSYPTSNGGTITATSKVYQSVSLNEDGTSVSDALYEYKSKYGYSVQYNNKYVVDFGEKDYDFSIKNADSTVNVVIKNVPIEEAIANIQTKEEWDTLMGGMLGECLEFQRTAINNMDTLISHYTLDYGNGQQSDVILAMLIGNEYIYSYMYNATQNAPSDEATQIGAVLYTIKEI